MPAHSAMTFAVATYGTSNILDTNLLISPCLEAPHSHQILIQKNFLSAANAHNAAIDQAVNDIVVIVHQDVVLPAVWLSQVERAIGYLDEQDPDWGVLGCYGATVDGRGWGCVYSFGVLGTPLEHPVPVQTLDEIVLILRKSSGLRFDERIPHFHFYGAGICLAAAARGMKSYAIPAFCIHNAQQQLVLPKEFYQCYKQFKRLWKTCLPIQTPCVRVSRFDVPMYQRRLKEVYVRYIARKQPARRLANVRGILEQLDVQPPH